MTGFSVPVAAVTRGFGRLDMLVNSAGFASNADSSYVTGEVFTLLGGRMRAA